MGSKNYETQILDAIQMLVDKAISKAEYDKTVQGTVSRCVDPTIGKYIIRYQDSSFYAYSNNTDVTYTAGTSVYVLIPKNDMTMDKTIMGTVDRLGPDYVSIIEGENGYEVTGINVINSENTFELCSYKNEEIKILYDKENDVDLINLDTFGFKSYIEKSNSIICGATVKTNLPAEQRFRGDYGIVFNLDFLDNATGEVVTRTYLVNTNEMTGQPYNYKTASRQYGIFEVDGLNFIEVKQIYLYQYNFPNTEENKPNDIFISNIELSAANALEETEAATCALTFITPQGIYFNENDLETDFRTIQAQVRIKGKAIDNNSQAVDYYWFIENNKINSYSEKYNQYGGAGWECLNTYNTIQEENENSEALVEWIPGKYQFITTKSNNVAKETKYKCVAIYNDDTILTKTIIIYNYDSNYEIEIKSDSGTSFYYDLGNPTLTCYINGAENTSEEYTYVWNSINNNNNFSNLNETVEQNNEYNDAIEKYNKLLEQIKLEQVLTGKSQEELDLYKRIITQYEHIMRIENNKIHKLRISEITKFTTYKCSVYKQNVFIGTASIIISNSLKDESGYSLIINNGNQVFKYNTEGIAPNNGSLDNPITLLPLTFTLYNEQGQEININAIKNQDISWTIPVQNTLLMISNEYGNPSKETDEKHTYSGYPELNFGIYPKYDIRKDNNTIELTVKYQEKILTTTTNFTFTKEGIEGTNGTDFICKIIPNVAEGYSPYYPTVTFNEYNQNYSLNYLPENSRQWFKAQLWHNGERIYEGTSSGVTTENERATIQWSILQNQYDSKNKDVSNLEINSATGEIDFITTEYLNPANIIKCTITYNGIDYYATMPVLISRVINDNYTIRLTERTGFRHVVYSTDGKYPVYDSAIPFDIAVTQIIDGIKEDVSLLELSEYKVDYDWNVLGNVFYTDWQSNLNLIEKTSVVSNENRNQKTYIPADQYDGLCVSNAIKCTVSRNGTRLGDIHIPVHFYINRYGNSALNGWDGNSISIDENGSGLILAPQIGAGIKNEDNSFTGVFMGSIKEAGQETKETGLFGYNEGNRTITLNAEDGSARFGRTGQGQIVISPNEGENSHSYLRSGNYVETVYEPAEGVYEEGVTYYIRKSRPTTPITYDYYITKDYTIGDTIKLGTYIRVQGEGLEIDLTDPHIRFGSGKFYIDSDGSVHAMEYATISAMEAGEVVMPSSSINGLDQSLNDLNNAVTDLDNSISYLEIFTPTDSIQFSTTTDLKPLESKTSLINFTISFKGKSVIAVPTLKSQNITGISAFIKMDSNIGELTFSVVKDVAIANVINIYIYEFTYTDTDGKIYKIEKQFTVILSVQGKDGAQGATGQTGKSAYQIAVDKGFEGNEEEWLESLVGQDGSQGIPGEPGKDGQTSYLHVAYANSADGTQDFTTSSGTNMKYIGQYTDFIEEDSQNPSDYTWTLIKGSDGAKGETGIGVSSIIEQYYLSTSNTSQTNGSWKTTQDTWVSGKYIWTRNEITWTDGSITHTSPILADALNKANTTANTANTNANNADRNATEAKNEAATATSTANNANQTAQNALSQANTTSQGLTNLTQIVNSNYDDLQKQIDGAIATWFYSYDPNTENTLPTKDWTTNEIKNQHLGDLFYIVDNEEKAGQCYRYALVGETYKWIIVEDAEVAKAIADAANAQSTADGKATIYTGANTPSNPQSGDLWMKSANDGILTYVNNQWIEYNKYTDDATANEAKNLASTANTTANTAKSTADSANATANTAHQEVQNTVNQVDIEYYLSTSATELIGGSWSTTAPNWVDGKYIWSRQKMYYVDSDKEPTYGEPACITGGKGATGADGKTGAEGKSAYQTALDQGFEGSEEDWLNSLIGQDGTGLESVTFLYYLTQNSENAPEKPTQTITENGDVKNQWTTKYATWESGYVYWTCSEILFTDGTYQWTTPILDEALNKANETANSALNRTETIEEEISTSYSLYALSSIDEVEQFYAENRDLVYYFLNEATMSYGTSNIETFKRIMAEELINYLFASSGSSRWMTSIANQSQDNSFVWQINFNLRKGDMSFEQDIFTEVETFNDLPELPVFDLDSETNENPYAGLNYKVAAQDIFGTQKERIYQCMLNNAGTAYEWVDLRLNLTSAIVSNIFCQNEPLRKIIDVRTEYQAALSLEQLTDVGWSIGAPAYSGTENQKLFARTKTIYNRHQLEEVSAPWEDSTWGGLILLQNNLNSATKTINDNLLHGTVRKTGDLIAVLDYNIGETRSNEKDENGNQTYGPKNVLIINSQGIGFSYNGLPISFYRAFGYASKISTSKDNILETSDTYYNEENINYSSTWTLDGTFNAENITVENLSATSIQDGILRLGNKTASGSLEFYDGQNLLLEITNSDNLHGLRFRHNNAKDINNPHFTYISHDSTEAIRTETADGKPILNVDIENETVTTQNIRVHNSVQYDGIGIINLNHNGHKGLAIIVTDSTIGS